LIFKNNGKLDRRSALKQMSLSTLSAVGLLSSATASQAGSSGSGADSDPRRTPDEVLTTASERLGLSGSEGIIGRALAEGSDTEKAYVALERQVFVLIKELAATRSYGAPSLREIKMAMGRMRPEIKEVTDGIDSGLITRAQAREAVTASFAQLVQDLSQVPRQGS
jgi:hypothetical protein